MTRLLAERSRGHVFVMALIAVLFLSVMAVSFGFNAVVKYQFTARFTDAHQAYLNAMSGLALARQRLNTPGFKPPWQDTLVLYEDEAHTCDAAMKMIELKIADGKYSFVPVETGTQVLIEVTGRYNGASCKTVKVLSVKPAEEDTVLFFYIEPPTKQPTGEFESGDTEE